MKLRLIVALCLLVVCVLPGRADEQRVVQLNTNTQREQMVTLEHLCNIFVSVAEGDQPDNPRVKIEMENLSENQTLIVFGRAYEEKKLKKLPISVRYDKYFGGSKGKRVTEKVEGMGEDMLVSPSDRKALFMVPTDHGQAVCRLPIYIAKQNRKKLTLMTLEVLELQIQVDVKPDEKFVRLSQQTDRLVNDVASVTFCTDRRHGQSVAQQKRKYVSRIEDLKAEIKNKRDGFASNTNVWKQWNELYQRVDRINLDEREGVCGRCSKPAVVQQHSCKYCNMSLDQVFHRLDDLYQRIYASGTNRKQVKKQVIGEVNALYGACTRSCPNLSSKWKRGGAVKNKIADRYSRINKF